MSLYANLQALRANPETAKAGIKWTPEEDEQLVNRATSKMDLEDIATHHKRTVGAVKSRIMSHALGYVTHQNMSTEDAADHFNINVDELVEHKKRVELKQDKKEQKEREREQESPKEASKSEQKKDPYMDILTDIRDLLKVIATEL